MTVWLMEVTQTVPNVVVVGVPMAGPDAVMAGWDALRNSMQRMGIGSREQFAEWIHNKGFPMPRLHQRWSSRAHSELRHCTRRPGFNSRICVRVDLVATPNAIQNPRRQQFPRCLLGNVGPHRFARCVPKPFPCLAERLPTCCARQVQTSSSTCARGTVGGSQSSGCRW